MVFFQSALFLAYIYSHYLAKRSGFASSTVLHSLALVAPVLVLPIGLNFAPKLNTVVHHPAVTMLILIAVCSIGLPFFVVATSAPLLQGYFSPTVFTPMLRIHVFFMQQAMRVASSG